MVPARWAEPESAYRTSQAARGEDGFFPSVPPSLERRQEKEVAQAKELGWRVTCSPLCSFSVGSHCLKTLLREGCGRSGAA